jgi:PKHD-type hydroxylase
MIIGSYGWYFWKNELDKKTCDKIIKLGKSKIKKTAVLKGDRKNKNIRNSSVTWLNEKWLYDIIQDYFYNANKQAGWNFEFDHFEDIQFTFYEKNNHYDWHNDSHGVYTEGPHKGKMRKLSCVISLTDPKKYTGGDFYFAVDQEKGINREACKFKEIKERGTVLIFPSYQHHKVDTVTKGNRYSLVIWALGKQYK